MTETVSHEERNRFILRRTLSAISWLYALWSLALAYMALTLQPRGGGILSSRTAGWAWLVHAALLGLAGWGLWRPRRAAWGWTLAASLGSLALVTLDAIGGRWRSVPIDLMYPLVAAAITLRVRP